MTSVGFHSPCGVAGASLHPQRQESLLVSLFLLCASGMLANKTIDSATQCVASPSFVLLGSEHQHDLELQSCRHKHCQTLNSSNPKCE